MRLTLLIAMLGLKLLQALHTGMSICKGLPPISRTKRSGYQLLQLQKGKKTFVKGQFKDSMAMHASNESSQSIQGPKPSIPSEYTDEDILSTPTIPLTTEEVELFKLFTDTVQRKKLRTTVRVAGGWVRDKLLGAMVKHDIDIALDDMTGLEFAKHLQDHLSKSGTFFSGFGIIQPNAEKSKHLETVTATYGKIELDFVNLRTEAYSEDSRVPQMSLGTPSEDAFRRDLTINALFYNIHTQLVEDFTGQGLADLRRAIVRTPLPSMVTLQDDPLRALRVLRFACRFDFSIAEETVLACCHATVHELLSKKVSKERIRIELNLMFGAGVVKAGRSLLLMHRYGLLSSVVPLPSALHVADPVTMEHVLEKTSKVVPVTRLLPVGEEQVRGLQASFLTGGVAHLLVAQYMHAQSGEYVHIEKHLVGEASSSVDHMWRIFIYAGLLTDLSDYIYLEPGRKYTPRLQYSSLVEHLVKKQLAMSARDWELITKIHSSCKHFQSMLSPGKSVEATTRLAVGLAIRASGEHFRVSMLFSSCRVVMDRIRASDTFHALSCREGALPIIVSEMVVDQLTILCGMTPFTPASQTPIACSESDVAAIRDMIRAETAVVMGEMDALQGLIDRECLWEAWALRPVFAGEALKALFSSLPISGGVIFKEIIEEQIKWQLVHPTGTDEELKRHLIERYEQYQ